MQPNDREEKRKIEREKRKAKKVKKLKIRNAVIKVVIGGFILMGVNEVYKEAMYDSFEPIDAPMSSTILMNAKNKSIYDYIYNGEVEDKDIIRDIDNLSVMTSVYRNVCELDLDKYNKNNELIIPEIDYINKSDIMLLVNKYKELEKKVDLNSPFKDTKEFYEVVAKLISYRRLLSSDRFVIGAEEINNFAEMFIKCTILDITGLGFENYSNIETNINGITDKDNFYVKYVDPKTGKEYDLKINSYSCLPYLVKDVQELNSTLSKYEIDKNTKCIVGKRNDLTELIDQENYTIDRLKDVITYEYDISNGKINQLSNKILKK